MNTRIYFNDKFVEFSTQPPPNGSRKYIILTPEISKAWLDQLRELIIDETNKKNIWLPADVFQEVFEGLTQRFKYIEAAGGFIENARRFLFICRHGRWDLPKGKLEKNESREHGAVRECEEECGVRNLVINRQLASTFHIYEHKGDYALKQTFWFHMHTSFEGELIPQLEEHITEVKWFGRREIRQTALKNTYYTIADVVNEGLSRERGV